MRLITWIYGTEQLNMSHANDKSVYLMTQNFTQCRPAQHLLWWFCDWMHVCNNRTWMCNKSECIRWQVQKTLIHCNKTKHRYTTEARALSMHRTWEELVTYSWVTRANYNVRTSDICQVNFIHWQAICCCDQTLCSNKMNLWVGNHIRPLVAHN